MKVFIEKESFFLLIVIHASKLRARLDNFLVVAEDITASLNEMIV